MNVACHLCAALALGATILCHAARAEEALTSEQQTLINKFHAVIPTLGEAMNTARAVLQKANDTAQADAAVPAVIAVSRAEKEVHDAASKLTEAGLSVSRLYTDGGLAKAISSLPIAGYNADIQSTLAAGCHGSVALYLAITEDARPYSNEQLHSRLSEQERADLAEIEQVLATLKEICPVSHWRALEDELVRRFDASLPAAERLQQRPLTAMLLHRLLEQHAAQLYELCNHCFHHNGELDTRFVLHPENYIGQWYSQRALSSYFYRYADNLERNSDTAQGKAIWEAAEPRLAELRKKYNLGTGDGRTRETAFDIPAEIKPEQVEQFVNDTTRELFGERAIHSDLHSSSVGKNGRYVVHGLILVGRYSDRNRNNGSLIIMPCYFNID